MYTNQGFIKLAVLVICIILLLSLFGVSLRSVVIKKDISVIKDNFKFVWEKLQAGWTAGKEYIKKFLDQDIITSENVYCATYNVLHLSTSPVEYGV